MTEMKLAVVPVDDGDVVYVGYSFANAMSSDAIHASECKLTREQIEIMSRAAEPHLWRTVSDAQDGQRLAAKVIAKEAIDRMIAAVKSVGFGVEGE